MYLEVLHAQTQRRLLLGAFPVWFGGGGHKIKPYTLFKKYFAEVGSEFLSCCVLTEYNLGFLDGWLDRTSLVYQVIFGNGMLKVTSRLACVCHLDVAVLRSLGDVRRN